jgi:nucleoid-associated protein YgaU
MSGVIFEGVLENLVQRFTLFLPSGIPVRARLSCTFKEWIASEVEARLQNKQSPDVAKTRTVRRGDTLSSIAAEEYADPALWRPIARANGIVNPRRLQPGQVLAIPVLHDL